MKPDESATLQPRLLRSLLMTVRYKDGRLDPTVLQQLWGRPLTSPEASVVANLLRMTRFLSLPQAVQFLSAYIEDAGGAGAVLDKLRAVVDELFAAVAAGHAPFSPAVRLWFGATSHRHEAALATAIAAGTLTRDGALALAGDGDALSRQLGQLTAAVPLTFRTTDFGGMPQRERAFDEIVFQEPARMTTPGGSFQFFVSNESEQRQLAHPEPDTIAWLVDTIRPDSVFYDVGANVGLYSLYAASLFRTVKAVCFEPAPMNISRLNANIRLNHTEAVLAFPIALAERCGLSTFGSRHFIAGGWGHPGITPVDATQQQLEAMVVQREPLVLSGCIQQTLDAFLHDARAAGGVLAAMSHPTHLKIDVDGPELQVLDGARTALGDPALQHVLVELQGDGEAATATALLRAHGFRLVQGATGFGNRIFVRDEPR